MRLPRFALTNVPFTIMFLLLLVLSGIVSVIMMPRSEDPQVTNSGGSIYVLYPGATSLDMEHLIVDPLEEAINELEDIKKMTTYMEDGLAVIHTEFQIGTDADEKYSDIIQKMNAVREKLPADLALLGTEKWSLSNVNIIQVALISEEATYRELEREAERLKKSIEKISGVKTAETWAFPELQVRIDVDMEKLALHHIPLSHVATILASSNKNIPGGFLDVGSRRFNVQTSGSFRTLDDVRNAIIHVSGTGAVIKLADVADVRFDYEEASYYARVNGKRAVFITANQKDRTNIFDIMARINAVLERHRAELPPSIRAEIVFDQSASVAHRLDSFFINLLQGLVLVALVVLFGVGLRAAFIVILAIPLSSLIGIGFLDLSGYGIEQMSIAGLVISLGLLVDNAIVVIENISRFIQRGKSHFEAAVEATAEIGWAIVSATATTVLAFLPMILMNNITGEFIRSMPLTVIFTLTASLFIALTLTPLLASKVLAGTATTPRKGISQRFIDWMVEHHYRDILRFSLKHRSLVLIGAFSVLSGSICLFPSIGVSFFPKADKLQLIININTPKGTSLEQTDQCCRYVETLLEKEGAVNHIVSNIGRGNPRIYYNIIPKRERSTHSQILVDLRQMDRPAFVRLIQRLRDDVKTYPHARIEVKELEQGPPVEAAIAIKILGDNLDMLRDLARDVEIIIFSIPGTVNIDNPLATAKTDIAVTVNREKAGQLGIALEEIDRTVRASIAGATISKFRDEEGQEFDMLIKLAGTAPAVLEDLDRIYVASMSGKLVPLNHVTTVEFKSNPMLISHYNMERCVTMTADVERGASANEITREIIRHLDEIEWPRGYRYYVAGELESQEESFGGLGKAVIIALLAIFGVLVLQFRSFIQPLVIFAAIPLAIIGSMIMLFITGHSFSFMAFIGIASLVGIVVNNSIILVDYTNQLRDRGLGILEALQTAGETRLLPILLTTVTTIGGLLPLTLQGGSLWAPMGWTIIGGLLTSTFLTLVIVPVLYSLMVRK